MAATIVMLAAGSARADVYGFVDEKGISHFSNVPLDKRYYLYRKDRTITTFSGSSMVIINVPAAVPRRTTNVSPAHRKQFAPMVSTVAKENGLDPALLHAVITVESGYNPKARSSKGAAGLMQLMPGTARRYQVTDTDPPRCECLWEREHAGSRGPCKHLLAVTLHREQDAAG